MFIIRKPPMGCESNGPRNTVNEYNVISVPTSWGGNMSENVAPVKVRGPAPKNPAKYRQMKIEATSCPDLAVANEKTENPNNEITLGR